MCGKDAERDSVNYVLLNQSVCTMYSTAPTHHVIGDVEGDSAH